MCPVEELIVYGLFKHFVKSGLTPGVALERLASILAMEPAMFTRMVPMLDWLRNITEGGE